VPSAADILTTHGIRNAHQAIAVDATVPLLDLAQLATMLEKESGGGNLWGHDAVQTGGAYTKGGLVTRESYEAYRALVRAGKIGRQGVGPAQLTYGPLQDRADERGGCWNWVINLTVGAEHLRDLIRQYGERDGFRRYNGSGAAAEAYAKDAMLKLAVWRARLAGATATPGAYPVIKFGERSEAVRRWQAFLVANFPAYAKFQPTGFFGGDTLAATKQFQRNKDLEDDGVVGPDTYRAAAEHGWKG
jgi:peptidoglycan hydrolase-like protein with peptidoglycan-binding domain